MKVEEYMREDGSIPYKIWFDSLDPQAAAKVTTAKYRLEAGLISAVKWFGPLGEYRIDWGPGYRIYLTREGDELIILFGGGSKKRQQTDIENATELLREYKSRKKALAAEKTQSDKKGKRRRI